MKEITLRALFRDTDAYAGQEVLIKGWVRNNRNSNKFGFIELNDGTFFNPYRSYMKRRFSTTTKKSRSPMSAPRWLSSARWC